MLFMCLCCDFCLKYLSFLSRFASAEFTGPGPAVASRQQDPVPPPQQPQSTEPVLLIDGQRRPVSHLSSLVRVLVLVFRPARGGEGRGGETHLHSASETLSKDCTVSTHKQESYTS